MDDVSADPDSRKLFVACESPQVSLVTSLDSFPDEYFPQVRRKLVDLALLTSVINQRDAVSHVPAKPVKGQSHRRDGAS